MNDRFLKKNPTDFDGAGLIFAVCRGSFAGEEKKRFDRKNMYPLDVKSKKSVWLNRGGLCKRVSRKNFRKNDFFSKKSVAKVKKVFYILSNIEIHN